MRVGGVHSLGSLLRKYQDLHAPQQTVVEACVRAAASVGIVCSATHCSYDPGRQILFIALSGPKKHELLLREKEIRMICAKDIGAKNTPRRIV